MRKQRVKAIAEALTVTRIVRGEEKRIGPERNQLRRAKEQHKRDRRGEPCCVTGRRHAKGVAWPTFANRSGQQRRANRADRREIDREKFAASKAA